MELEDRLEKLKKKKKRSSKEKVHFRRWGHCYQVGAVTRPEDAGTNDHESEFPVHEGSQEPIAGPSHVLDHELHYFCLLYTSPSPRD